MKNPNKYLVIYNFEDCGVWTSLMNKKQFETFMGNISKGKTKYKMVSELPQEPRQLEKNQMFIMYGAVVSK